jgi:site-specific DNA-methyltransferase (adenine-specific)
MTGTLYIDDCVEVMKNMPECSVDLIYLDPPYNSNRDYIGTSNGEVVGHFIDTWTYADETREKTDRESAELELKDDKLSKYLEFIKEGSASDKNHYAYLTFMARRLIEMKRILKPTGSIYLHVDPTESHYLKIIMDIIFGIQNYRNEIVWRYKRWTASKKSNPRLHDIILFYTKSQEYYFKLPMTENTKPNPSQYISMKINGKTVVKRDENGNPIKREASKEIAVGDVWEIPIISPVAKERLGYPTQKPEALLERIISASCPDGGTILDPFSGCGTSCAVAAKTGLNYIGIDISSKAEEVIRKRFIDAGQPEPKIIHSNDDGFEVQKRVNKKLGLTDGKMRSDGGVDGFATYRLPDGKICKVVCSVKSGVASYANLNEIHGVMHSQNANMCVLVTGGSITRNMRNLQIQTGRYKGVDIIQIYTVDDVLSGRVKIDKPEGAVSE